jgi:hypothetical protein
MPLYQISITIFLLQARARPRDTHRHTFITKSHKTQEKVTRNEALAAVTVPCGLMKAGFSLAISLTLEGRIPLSTTTGSARPIKKKQRNNKT